MPTRELMLPKHECSLVQAVLAQRICPFSQTLTFSPHSLHCFAYNITICRLKAAIQRAALPDMTLTAQPEATLALEPAVKPVAAF